MSLLHEEISARLAVEPFAPFSIETTDGRIIVVKERSRAVLNSLALSVVEEALSVTVVGLGQIKALRP